MTVLGLQALYTAWAEAPYDGLAERQWLEDHPHAVVSPAGLHRHDYATFVPHDPDHEGGCHQHEGTRCNCNICGTPWPCPIRKEQRAVIKSCLGFLRDNLFDRATNLPEDPVCGMRWSSPIGWSVFLAYGEGNAWVTIREPSGKPYASTTHLTVEFLIEHLP